MPPKNSLFSTTTRLGGLDLAILLYSSPLPPSATLKRLKEGFEIRDSSDVLEVARRDEVAGSRDGLRSYIEERLGELRIQVETSEAVLQQLSELMMLFTTTLPLIVVGLVFMVSPQEAAPLLLGFSLAGVAVGLAAQFKVPQELRLPGPGWRPYLPLSLVALPFLLDALHVVELGEKVFLLAAAMALPSAYLVYLEERRLLDELKENRELIIEALRCPFHLYRCLGVDKLRGPTRLAISRTVRAALLLMGRFGAEREALHWLYEYYRQRYRLIRDVRERTLVSLLNGLVGVAVLAVGLSMLYTVYTGLPPVNMAGISIDPHAYASVKPLIGVVLAVNSVSYSVATASLREGNPLYLPLYLPAMLLATYVGLQLGPLILPQPG